jgi:hypothetical protein
MYLKTESCYTGIIFLQIIQNRLCFIFGPIKLAVQDLPRTKKQLMVRGLFPMLTVGIQACVLRQRRNI